MRTHRRVIGMVLVLLTCAGARAATIDMFTGTSDGSPLIVPRTILGPATVFEPMIGGVIGGERITTVTGITFDDPGIDMVQAAVFPSVGVFDYSSSAGATGEVMLTYRNSDGPDGLDADLSGDALVRVDVTHFDLAGGVPMAVSVLLDDGIDTAMLTKPVNVSGAQTLDFLFSDFPPADFAALDLLDIDRIVLTFSPGQAADFRIDSITTQVPEPAGVMLLLVGAAALPIRRSR